MLAMLARLCEYVGDANRAAVLERHLRPHAGHLAVDGVYGLCIGSIDGMLGALAALQEHWDDAEESCRAALELEARVGAQPFVAQTRCGYARMLVAREGPGDRAKAA